MSLPPAVRILPMDSENEFPLPKWTVKRLQYDFFLGDLVENEGEYWYQQRGMIADPGSVVLFQFRSAIVASAEFEEAEAFDEPEIGENGLIYHGAFYFRVPTISVFMPIGADTMELIWGHPSNGYNRFKRFSQAKQSLDPECYPRFPRRCRFIRHPNSDAGESDAADGSASV